MHRTATVLALALGLTAASVVTASAQQYGYNYAPPGSYQQSCVNVQMRGSTLSASCTSTSGQRVYSSLNVSGCNGDIANVNGYLACNGNNGYYNNGYGYNNRGRNGDDDNDGDRDNGHRHHHHPNGNAYGYYGNGNGNGNGNGYNGGYGNYGGYGYGLPSGSYQQSCTNERMNGSVLSASCNATNGAQVYSSIDVRRCQSRGTDIANRNGYLSC